MLRSVTSPVVRAGCPFFSSPPVSRLRRSLRTAPDSQFPSGANGLGEVGALRTEAACLVRAAPVGQAPATRQPGAGMAACRIRVYVAMPRHHPAPAHTGQWQGAANVVDTHGHPNGSSSSNSRQVAVRVLYLPSAAWRAFSVDQ